MLILTFSRMIYTHLHRILYFCVWYLYFCVWYLHLPAHYIHICIAFLIFFLLHKHLHRKFYIFLFSRIHHIHASHASRTAYIHLQQKHNISRKHKTYTNKGNRITVTKGQQATKGNTHRNRTKQALMGAHSKHNTVQKHTNFTRLPHTLSTAGTLVEATESTRELPLWNLLSLTVVFRRGTRPPHPKKNITITPHFTDYGDSSRESSLVTIMNSFESYRGFQKGHMTTLPIEHVRKHERGEHINDPKRNNQDSQSKREATVEATGRNNTPNHRTTPCGCSFEYIRGFLQEPLRSTFESYRGIRNTRNLHYLPHAQHPERNVQSREASKRLHGKI